MGSGHDKTVYCPLCTDVTTCPSGAGLPKCYCDKKHCHTAVCFDCAEIVAKDKIERQVLEKAVWG